MYARVQSIKGQFSRPLAVWLVFVHLMAVVAVVHGILFGAHCRTILLAVVWYFAGLLAVTMGNHRLFAHRSYVASKSLETLLLLVVTSVMQGETWWWAGLHRRHHAFTDTEKDPHSIKKGFGWAHTRWLLYSPELPSHNEIKDLLKNPRVRFQDRWYLRLAVFTGFVGPALIALTWGDWIGGLLDAGFLRLMLQFHTTWSINSVAHSFGVLRYKIKRSARSCYPALLPIMATLTVGEINHERHHWAEEDCRFGSFDPGWWAIWLMLGLGLASKPIRTKEAIVWARVRHAQAAQHLSMLQRV